MNPEIRRWLTENIMTDSACKSPDIDIAEFVTKNVGAIAQMLRIRGVDDPVPSHFPTPEEVRSEIQARSKKIFEYWNLLRNIVERYESVIRKRWLGKTREKRKEILLRVFPDMPLSHRPDFREAFKGGTENLSEVSKRNSYLWPHINLEDLLKPRSLLLFLNSRGRNTPDAFTRADLNASYLSRHSNAIKVAFLSGHLMVFAGRQTPETYGELVAIDYRKRAQPLVFTQRGMDTGYGLCSLEIQERLYCFLVDCCKTILHEIQEVSLGDSTVPVQPEPPSLSSYNTGLVSLVDYSTEAPYRIPANFDLERVYSIAAAKYSAVIDHVWALHEDPEYFAETVLDYSEHRQERLSDVNGAKHSSLTNPVKEYMFWKEVVGGVITTAIINLNHWGIVRDRVKELRDLQKKYEARISIEKGLPKDYDLAFCKLRFHLVQYVTESIEFLRTSFVSSPPTRRFFVRMPEDPASTNIKVVRRTEIEVPVDNASEELIWLILTICEKHKLSVRFTTLMDQLGYLLATNSQAKDLTSAWVADRVSDLTVCSQMMHQIDLYQPWAAASGAAKAQYEDELQAERVESTKPLKALLSRTLGDAIISLGNPTDGKFTYPVNRPRTKENVDKMRNAERNLDTFWQAVDRELISKKAVPPQLEALLKRRVLLRTAEYKEPLKYTLRKPLSEVYLERDRLYGRTVLQEGPQAPRHKPKTRGVARALKNDPEDTPNPRHPLEDEESTLRVDKRATKTFKVLFFIPSVSAQPGEVAWGDFVHAMVSAGFWAEKLYGSVWQFVPTMLDVEKSIQFHEPHPSGKLSFNTVRRFGRRLNRAYGWHGGMFVAT